MFKQGNMAQMLKQARDVQKKIEEVQNELDDLVVEGDAGDHVGIQGDSHGWA